MHDQFQFSAPFWPALSVSILAMAANSFGLVAATRHFRWFENHNLTIAAFAVGVLVTTSLVHLLPESAANTTLYWLYFPLGAFVMSMVSSLISWCARLGKQTYASSSKANAGFIPVLGIGFHSFTDGLAYATTFQADYLSGTLTALGLILHEIPEGIIAVALLLGAGFSGSVAFATAFVLTGLTTPLGLITTFPIIASLSISMMGNMLAATGGALLFVAFAHLLPRIIRDGSKKHLAAIIAGAALSLALILIAH